MRLSLGTSAHGIDSGNRGGHDPRCHVGGVVGYLVKPFATTELAARLSGYARYRKILASRNLSSSDVDVALEALRSRITPPQPATIAASSTKQLVLQALRKSEKPMSAAEISAGIGILSRAIAQGYLLSLAATSDVTIGLRYGTTGRLEHEFAPRDKRRPRPLR